MPNGIGQKPLDDLVQTFVDFFHNQAKQKGTEKRGNIPSEND